MEGPMPRVRANINRFMAAIFAFALVFAFSIVPLQQAKASECVAPQSGDVRIHIMPFRYSDAIIIECDGHFGIVDSGEDSNSPDGSDPRYPVRPNTTIGDGHEDEVIAYMESIGVTEENLDFYIGTHAHSDHIASAPDIIKRFHPKTIYLAVYDDSLITNSGNLWDNQYVYDRFVEAALWAESTYGAKFIQHLDPNFVVPAPPASGEDPDDSGSDDQGQTQDPKDPSDESGESKDSEDSEVSDSSQDANGDEDESLSASSPVHGDENNADVDKSEDSDGADDAAPQDPDDDKTGSTTTGQVADFLESTLGRVGSPVFMLGSAKIEILNYDETYLKTKVPDANYFSYGVKITAANGRTAFLAGDINNFTDGDANGIGDEDSLKDIIGPVDFFKIGHHGVYGSNSSDYLNTIIKQAEDEDRAVVVQTGDFRVMSTAVLNILKDKGARYFSAPEMPARGESALVADLTSDGVKTNAEGDESPIFRESDIPSRTSFTYDGVFVEMSGWHETENGKRFYFGDGEKGESSFFPLTDRWAILDGSPVYIDKDYSIIHYAHNDDIDADDLKEGDAKRIGWHKVGADWVHYDSKGFLTKGWLYDRGAWYYLRDSGTMAKGWENIEGSWYYMNSSGVMQTGWLDDRGRWFYMGTSGAMQTGWLYRYGIWYYLRDSGAMATGWQEVNGVWYYMNSSGAMLTGWQLVGGTWYYMNASGAMQTGWIRLGGSWYYLGDNGAMAIGWQEVDGVWYYMNASGSMHTGWLDLDGTWFFFNSSGTMQTGWIYLGGAWYFLDDSGAMATGWHEVNDTWYCMSSSGAMLTGWIYSGGAWYFLGASGAMMTDTWIGNYYVGSDGVMLTNQWVGKYHVGYNGLWDRTDASRE